MKLLTFLLMNALILITMVLPAFSQNAKVAIDGNWLGTLDAGGMKMRLVLKVEKNAEGYAARFDSPDQGAKDLPIDSITLIGDKVSFAAARFGISFEGTLNEAGDEINGTFKQGAGSTPFVFKRIAEIPKTKRPQEPSKPYPYAEKEVAYKNEKDNVKLTGTLTLPRAEGKHPAVILITGSGAQDRDETIAGHRPFLVLADYLTRRGVAVLRVDDRGVGGSGGGSLSETSENFAGDVLAGIEYLKTRKEIDSKRIGLIGHSEGGMIAPMVAAGSKDVAFIVMLAGMGQTGEDVILTQLAAIQKASSAQPEAIAESVDFQKTLLSIIRSERDDKRAERQIDDMLALRKSKMNDRELKEFARVEADLKSQLPALLSPWYRFFISYDPRPTLGKIKTPVLALNGEADVQVSSKENLALISKSLEAGKNKDFTVKSLPRLNHLFQTSKTGLPNEYGEIEETFSPDALQIIADWILERTAIKGERPIKTNE